jgi:hypothetical protein
LEGIVTPKHPFLRRFVEEVSRRSVIFLKGMHSTLHPYPIKKPLNTAFEREKVL